jgi:hypothetical protein
LQRLLDILHPHIPNDDLAVFSRAHWICITLRRRPLAFAELVAHSPAIRSSRRRAYL